MVLKIKNKEFGSWIWIDAVDSFINVPCEVIKNPEKGGLDFAIEASNKSIYDIDRYFRWPLEIGDKVNALIIKTGYGQYETLETVVTEYDSVYILGSDGKTLDRI